MPGATGPTGAAGEAAVAPVAATITYNYSGSREAFNVVRSTVPGTTLEYDGGEFAAVIFPENTFTPNAQLQMEVLGYVLGVFGPVSGRLTFDAASVPANGSLYYQFRIEVDQVVTMTLREVITLVDNRGGG